MNNYLEFQKLLKKWDDNWPREEIDEIKDLFIRGYNEQEIYIELGKKEWLLEKAEFGIQLAKFIIKNDFTIDKTSVISEHIRKYDDEILRLRNFIPKVANSYLAKKLLNEAYWALLDVLFQKEKLAGLHLKKLNIKVNNETQINLLEKKDSFDLSTLSLQEKIEFLNLINKATIGEDELNAIIPRKHQEQENKTIDISHEEVKEEKVNIDEIQIEKVEKKPTYVEYVPPMTTIEDKLKETLRKKAEEAFSKLKDHQLDSEKEKK